MQFELIICTEDFLGRKEVLLVPYTSESYA